MNLEAENIIDVTLHKLKNLAATAVHRIEFFYNRRANVQILDVRGI